MINGEVNVDVVDRTSDNGFNAKQLEINQGAVIAPDVRRMVNCIIYRAGNKKVARLRIFAHGNTGMQAVSGGQTPSWDQVVAVNNAGNLVNQDHLKLLTGYFAADGLVQLHGCLVGSGWKGQALVKALAALWNVRVQAALVNQFADKANAFEGSHYVEADGRNDQTPTVTQHAI
jgi:hypothetical protein